MCNEGQGEAGQPPAPQTEPEESAKCKRHDARHLLYVHSYRVGCIVVFILLTGVLPEKLAQVISATVAFYSDKIVALIEVYFP
jgi:hypothetical protein